MLAERSARTISPTRCTELSRVERRPVRHSYPLERFQVQLVLLNTISLVACFFPMYSLDIILVANDVSAYKPLGVRLVARNVE